MAKVMKMAAILFCCQFEDQDPKITLDKQVFRIQHHQIAFNYLSNYFYHKINNLKRRAKILKNGGHFVLLPN